VVEIDKTIAITVTTNAVFKWILGSEEPTTVPEGYTRSAALDIDLGALGILYAYVKD